MIDHSANSQIRGCLVARMEEYLIQKATDICDAVLGLGAPGAFAVGVGVTAGELAGGLAGRAAAHGFVVDRA